MSAPLVEILYFDGCPNHHPAIALVERISNELGIDPDLRLVNVLDQTAAQELRFLGSPTIRVGGIDVDPYTEERDDYALSCRIFSTDAGIAGQPDERWVREALQREAAVGFDVEFPPSAAMTKGERYAPRAPVRRRAAVPTRARTARPGGRARG